MVDTDDGAALESRPPLLEDLLTICRALNERGARYVVVGGMAVIHDGFVRATEDIDLLVGACSELLLKLKRTVREKDAVDRRFLELLVAWRAGRTD